MKTFEFRVRNTTNGVKVPIRIAADTLADARIKILSEIQERGHLWEVGDATELEAPCESPPAAKVAEYAPKDRLPPSPESLVADLQRRQNALLEELLVEVRTISRRCNHIMWAAKAFAFAFGIVLLNIFFGRYF